MLFCAVIGPGMNDRGEPKSKSFDEQQFADVPIKPNSMEQVSDESKQNLIRQAKQAEGTVTE